MRKKILMIAPKTKTFINFRGDLIKDIIKKEYDVTVIVPEKGYEDFFNNLKVKVRYVNLDKNSYSIFNAIAYYKSLVKILKEEKPDKVFSYTIKPVIFGSIAAKKAKVNEIYSLICGLGYLFSVNTFKVKLLRFVCGIAYKIALKFNTKVIFQNKEDIKEFVKRRYVSEQKCCLVYGSGVNLNKFKRNKLPKKISFIMVSRIIKEKGVMEYFNAAKIIKQKYKDVTFLYVGAIDKTSNQISLDTLKPFIDNKYVLYVGETQNVEEYLKKASVFVLPSYYREGIPKTLIEALAMARPIITTKMPGCNQIVIEGKNGYFVDTKNVDDLVLKMEKMIKNKEKLQKMGEESYKLCLKKFTIDKINKNMMKIMKI